jgi:hypothetical protein
LKGKHLSDQIVENMDCHHKKSNCQGCGKTYAHRQSLYNHRQKCQTLRNKKKNEGDGSDVNEKDSQTTTTKSVTSGQIVGKKNHHRKVNCRECGKPMWSNNIRRHMQTCQALRNKKKNEGDVGGVNETNSQTTTTKSETIGQKIADIVMERVQPILSKKRKADCLEETEDIPTTFEKTEFDGVESLSNENHARILKLEKKNLQ